MLPKQTDGERQPHGALYCTYTCATFCFGLKYVGTDQQTTSHVHIVRGKFIASQTCVCTRVCVCVCVCVYCIVLCLTIHVRSSKWRQATEWPFPTHSNTHSLPTAFSCITVHGSARAIDYSTSRPSAARLSAADYFHLYPVQMLSSLPSPL